MADETSARAPGARATARTIVLPGVLAVTAGFVDAVGFLHLFGVFPANQSGNLVLFGMAFASPVPPPAWISATSIVGFAAGTAAGAWLGGRLPAPHRRRTLLAIELALLIGLAVANAMVDPSTSASATADPVGPGVVFEGATLAALLLVASLAMGIQTEAIRRAAGVAVSTTYQTGAMARLGESVANPDRTAERRFPMGTIVVLAALVACYVVGAALGAGPLGDGRSGLVAPCLTVGVVLLATCLRPGDAD